jgi:hypothetical protein
MFGYLAVVAGARYQIRVGRWAGGALNPFDYVLRADYHPVPDLYEPNETFLEAADIELGSAVNAYLVVGYESSTVSPADFDDWYAFTSDAGQIEVDISAVPVDVYVYARVHGPDYAGVGAAVSSADRGALVNFTRTLTSSGTHFLRISYNSNQPPSGDFTDVPGEVPVYFTNPYTFTIRRL